MSKNKSKRKNADLNLDFFSPAWSVRTAGTVAAMWTRSSSTWFNGPYEKVDDLNLWLVRCVEGRPVLFRFDCRADLEVGTVRVSMTPDSLAAVWDLSAPAGSPGSLVSERDGMALEVADSFVERWLRTGPSQFPAPPVFVGYPNRVEPRKTVELMDRIQSDYGDRAGDPRSVHHCWDRVPTMVGAATRNPLFLYPAAMFSSDSPRGYEYHPDTMTLPPEGDDAAASGWTRRGGRWVPTIPPGGGRVYVGVQGVSGIEVQNLSWGLLKHYNIIPAKADRRDAAAMAALREWLSDREQCVPATRFQLMEELRSQLPRWAKYTHADLFEALLNPDKPVTASTQSRVFVFAETELEGISRRGWSFDFTIAAEAATEDPAVAGQSSLVAQ